MNQIPEFTFELRTNRTITARFTNTYINQGAGLAWSYASGKWSVQGAGTSTQNLYRGLTIPTNSQVKVVLGIRAIKAGTLVVSFYDPTTPNTNQQEICSRYFTAGPQLQIVNFTVNTYANVRQFINFQVTSPVADIEFTLENILIDEVDGNRRVVKPGNFKSLGGAIIRNKYFGSHLDLTGALTLVGEDWRWVNSILFDYPTRLIRVVITIKSGTDVFTTQPVLLDTITYQGIATEISYQATFNLLTLETWQQLLSYFDERIDLQTGYDVDGKEVVDGYRNDTYAAVPSAGSFAGRKNIVMQQKFHGYARVGSATAPIAVPADSIVFIGFGFDVPINDDFKTETGASTNPSLETDGIFTQIIGTVKLTYTRSNAALIFEYLNTNAGTWVPMTSGTQYNINIIAAGWDASFYNVRVRNSANNATHTFYLSATPEASFLNIVARVRYPLRMYGYRPMKALKAYVARILGEYDNTLAPVFQSGYFIGSSGWSIVDTGQMHPPPLTGSSNDPAKTGPAQGQYYTGGDRWIPTGNTGVITNGTRSNMWVTRAGQGKVTDYFSKGMTYTIAVTASGRANVTNIKIYGTYGLSRDLLATLANPTLSTNVTITKYYDGIGFEVEGTNFSFTVSGITITKTGADPVLGKYAKNHIANGIGIFRGTDVNSLSNANETDLKKYTLATSLSTIISSLINIYGLTIYPEYDSVGGYTKVVVDELSSVFIQSLSSVTIKAEKWTVEPDEEFVYDMINVGGTFIDEFEFYGDASSTESNYSSDYISSKRVKDMRIPASLNTPQLITLDLGNKDIAIVDMYAVPYNSTGQTLQYRLDEELTISNTNAALQPNWLYSEGRLVRNNSTALFAGGTTAYRLMFGKWSNLAAVAYSGDTLGAITDADPILGTSAVRARKVTLSTALTLAEFTQVIADRYKQFLVVTESGDYINYLKSIEYNFATGRANVVVWLRSQVDVQFTNPRFINTLDPWLVTIAGSWTWQNVTNNSQGLAKSGSNVNSLLYQDGVNCNIEQGFILEFKIVAVPTQQIANTNPILNSTGWVFDKQFLNPRFLNSLIYWLQDGATNVWTWVSDTLVRVYDNDNNGSNILYNNPDQSGVSSVRFGGNVYMQRGSSILPEASWSNVNNGAVTPWTNQGTFWQSGANAINAGQVYETQRLQVSNSINVVNGSSTIRIQGRFTAPAGQKGINIGANGFLSQTIVSNGSSTPAYTDEPFDVTLTAFVTQAVIPTIVCELNAYTNLPLAATFKIDTVTCNVSGPSGDSTIEIYHYISGAWYLTQAINVPFVDGNQTIPDTVVAQNAAATRTGIRFVGNPLNSVNMFELSYFLNTNAWFLYEGLYMQAKIPALQTEYANVTDPASIGLINGVTKMSVTYTVHAVDPGVNLLITGFPSQPLAVGDYTIQVTANVNGNTVIGFATSGKADMQIKEAKILAAPVDIIIVGRTGGVNTNLYTITRDVSSGNVESVNVDMSNGIAYDNLGIRVNTNNSAGYAEIYYFQKKSI